VLDSEYLGGGGIRWEADRCKTAVTSHKTFMSYLGDTTHVVFFALVIVISVIGGGIVFSESAGAASNTSLTVNGTDAGLVDDDVSLIAEADADLTTQQEIGYINVSSAEFDLRVGSAADANPDINIGENTRSEASDFETIDATADYVNISLDNAIVMNSGDSINISLTNRSVTNPSSPTTASVTVDVGGQDSFTESAFIGDRNADRFSWDVETGSGAVSSDNSVFQGEEEITFINDSESIISPTNLERTAGASEGETLSVPIPQDQPVGSYESGSSADLTVTVQTARITEFEIRDEQGEDVSGGVITADQKDATASVEYNFDAAEKVELTVESKDGIDLTNQFVGSDATIDNNGEISFDPSTIDPGEYTFTVEGTDDLDFGQASQSTTVTIAAVNNDALGLDVDFARHGEDMGYTVTGGTDTGEYLVTVNKTEFNETTSALQATQIFQNDGDTVETGLANETATGQTDIENVDYAYAIVQVDGSTATGSINTEYLNQTAAEVALFGIGEGPEGENITTPVASVTRNLGPQDPIYNGTIPNDGTTHTLGFPGPIAGDLNDIFAGGNNGIDAIYRFNSETDSWEQQTDFTYTPTQLSAIAIVTSGEGPDEIQLEIEIEEQEIVSPGERELDTGWNFVAPSTYDTPKTVFDRGTTAQSLVVDSYGGPQLVNTQTVATFRSQRGSAVYDIGGSNPPLMNPFKGYFLYVTESGAQPAVIGNVDTRRDVDTAINATGN